MRRRLDGEALVRTRAKPFLLVMICMFLVSGCGSTNTGSVKDAGAASVQESKTDIQDPFAGAIQVEVPDLQSGLIKMNTFIKDYKKAVEADQADQAKELAMKMAGVWNAIKSEVSAKASEQHAIVEKSLTELLTNAQAKDPDKDLLIQLNYTLYQQFRDLKQLLEESK
jgi:hypothetical protein